MHLTPEQMIGLSSFVLRFWLSLILPLMIRVEWVFSLPFFFSWHAAALCGILVPRAEIEHQAIVVKVLNPNHYTTRELLLPAFN